MAWGSAGYRAWPRKLRCGESSAECARRRRASRWISASARGKVTPSLLSARKKGFDGSDEFEKNHVREIADHIVDRSPEIQQRVKDGRCAVVGLRYCLSDGFAEPLVGYGIDV